MQQHMATQWLRKETLYKVERAVAERAVQELRERDPRWQAEIVDNGEAGTVRIKTLFDGTEVGPTARVGVDMLPEMWADALDQLFKHPARESARRDRTERNKEDEFPW